MKKIVFAAAVVATLSGCASVMNETTHPMRVETRTPDGQMITGADCKLTNDKAQLTMRSGDTVPVRRSSKDLDIICTHQDLAPASGRAISRANSGMWGNLLIGGGIGAIVDHNKGTAYTYPTWVQLVFGSTLSFDRKAEEEGAPVAPEQIEVSPADTSASKVSALP